MLSSLISQILGDPVPSGNPEGPQSQAVENHSPDSIPFERNPEFGMPVSAIWLWQPIFAFCDGVSSYTTPAWHGNTEIPFTTCPYLQVLWLPADESPFVDRS